MVSHQTSLADAQETALCQCSAKPSGLPCEVPTKRYLARLVGYFLRKGDFFDTGNHESDAAPDLGGMPCLNLLDHAVHIRSKRNPACHS